MTYLMCTTSSAWPPWPAPAGFPLAASSSLAVTPLAQSCVASLTVSSESSPRPPDHLSCGSVAPLPCQEMREAWFSPSLTRPLLRPQLSLPRPDHAGFYHCKATNALGAPSPTWWSGATPCPPCLSTWGPLKQSPPKRHIVCGHLVIRPQPPFANLKILFTGDWQSPQLTARQMVGYMVPVAKYRISVYLSASGESQTSMR